MAGLSTGIKEKLTIARCAVNAKGQVIRKGEGYAVLKGKGNTIELMLNPSEYEHSASISYTGGYSGRGDKKGQCSKTPLGQLSPPTRFVSVDAEKVSFNAVIDGTGVVELPGSGAGYPDVNTQINDLKKVAYQFDGENHEPPVVRLSWGKLDLSGVNITGKYFYGRLTSLNVKYTLFKPSGEPLRAKVSMGFVSFMTLEESALRKNQSSPDLSHLVEVRAGDTLPLLCQRIYKDSRQHLVVARENRLSNFRDLKPGTLLRFPPLD